MSKDGKIEKMKCHLRTTKKSLTMLNLAVHSLLSITHIAVARTSTHAMSWYMIGSSPAGDQILSRA